MSFKIFNKKGFTLLELLIVIVIVAIISLILVVNWQRNEKQYQLQRVAQEIAQDIRMVQDMALNSYKYLDQIPDNYGLYFDESDKTSYIIFGDMNGNNSYQGTPPDLEIENISIESGIEINSLSSGVQDLHITFSLPDGFTNFNPSATLANIVIKKTDADCDSGPQECRKIEVMKTGQVNIKNLE
jgi:prepilin-type N-terminal cleavage/methylation domain-containing protein